MGKIFTKPLALADLNSIWDYIAADNPSNADKLLYTIADTCRTLSDFPQMGRLRPEIARNLRSFPVEDYLIFYRSRRGGIEIVRVLHSSRDIYSVF